MGWSWNWSRGRKIDFVWGNDHDVHPAIQAPAVFGGITGNRMKLGVTGGGEPLRINALAHQQKPDHLGSAGGGKLPVRLKLSRVNGDIIGMPFNSEVARD